MRLTAHPPSKITIVSHAFKRDRFLSLHCRALRWPKQRVAYVGVNPPQDEERWAAIERGVERAALEWRDDCFGFGTVLAGKRRARGWWEGENVNGPAELEGLLVWRGGVSGRGPYPGVLPWEDEVQ